MNLLIKWAAWTSQPKWQRIFTILFAIYALVIIIFLAFFVPTTILRDSDAAMNVVQLATSIFPWLKKIPADATFGKALFIHSILFFIGMFPNLFLIPQIDLKKKWQFQWRRLLGLLGAAIFFIIVSIGFYYMANFISLGFFEKFAFLNPVGMVLHGLIVSITFWQSVIWIFIAVALFLFKQPAFRN